MRFVETNLYLIENLKDLNCRYKTYKIRGIPESDDQHKNVQLLVNNLSKMTKSPCAAFSIEQDFFIAQPEGYVDLPSSIDLIRATAKIEKLPELSELNFGSLDSLTAMLASRFLQFSLQNPLYRDPELWQPETGYPFYSKFPDPEFRSLSRNIDLYRGFTFRVAVFKNNRIGVCVDTRSKYVDRNTLPTKISREEFREKYKGLKCLYEYGDTWYEIKLGDYVDLTVDEVEYPKGTMLFDHIQEILSTKKSPNIRTLPKDSSVLVYYTSFGEPRHVPSGLCRLTYGTNHPDVKPFHPMTIRPPFIRRQEIQFIVNKFFRNLTFGSANILLADKPTVADMETMDIPDLQFGNGKILSVRGSKDSTTTSLEEFPLKKKELLYSREAGLFTKKPFYRQFFIMPNSIYESFGDVFIENVKQEVQRLYHTEEEVYSPIKVPYNDSVHPSVHNLSREIIKSVTENEVKNGFGVIVIPRLPHKAREEDQLANFLMTELRKREVYISIIHTDVPKDSYEYVTAIDGSGAWTVVYDRKQSGRLKGYIRNVVLNKILITNNVWPFVLRTPLNADLTIGIDVKNKTAGFTLIYKHGSQIRFIPSQSDEKEQLGRKHLATRLYEILKEEQKLLSKDIRKIVVHRQGTLFPTEKKGIAEALNMLENENLLPKNPECTFVEIRTTSRIPFRVFDVSAPPGRQKEMVYNPTVGMVFAFSEDDAFVCTTGYPYRFKGTSKPLHVVRVEGKMALREIVEDVFYLSNLTYTKIDDCLRVPLTVKMNDIRLREIAGKYDHDTFRYGDEDEE